jgi:hypothetical protein
MLLLVVALGTATAQEPIPPTLPQETVNLTLPMQGTSTCPSLTTGSNCIRNVPAGDARSFQSAINAATCGDTIVLQAGSTYSGNFTIPATTCLGWIEIVSSALASLPQPGTRVGPANALNMATISTPNTSPAIAFHANANHWRLIGLEITTSYISTANTVYNLVQSGYQKDGSAQLSVQSQIPAFVIFDRIYIHGLSNANVTRGIFMDFTSVGIVDSYCSEIHHNGNDSQCFASIQGPGPFLIQNNYIQAGAENIMFGGNDPAIANLVPSDITIVGNLIEKNLTWRGQAAPLNWVVKNLFELKNAQRVLFDGNVLQYDWAAGQSVSVLLRSVNQNGACTWCVVQDVTFTHNLLQHIPAGVETAATDSGFRPAQPTARILIRNNLLTDVSSKNWGPSQGTPFFAGSNSTYSTHDIIFDHNTAFSDNKAFLLGDSGHVVNLQFTNNLITYAIYGVFGSGVASGSIVFTTFSSNFTYNQNVFIYNTEKPVAVYPAGTLWTALSGVKFTSITGIAPAYNGNFQLLSSSPYHNAGTDGKDIGVSDWTCLNNDVNAAMTGVFRPGTGGCAKSADALPLAPTNTSATTK